MAITASEFGLILGAERGTFQRVQRDIHFGTAGTHFLADIEHRRLVAFTLTDHDAAGNRQIVQLAAHGVDSHLVGGFLVPLTTIARGSHSGGFDHTCHLHRQHTVEMASLGGGFHVHNNSFISN